MLGEEGGAGRGEGRAVRMEGRLVFYSSVLKECILKDMKG